MKKAYAAEFIGAMAIVLFGCDSLAVNMSFGIIVMAMIIHLELYQVPTSIRQ